MLLFFLNKKSYALHFFMKVEFCKVEFKIDQMKESENFLRCMVFIVIPKIFAFSKLFKIYLFLYLPIQTY